VSDDSHAGRGGNAERRRGERERFARGLPGYHDPRAGIGGAPPAVSALTLRLVLATFGLAVCTGAAILLAVAGAPVGFTVVVAVLAVPAVIDIPVIIYRKRRGEPGEPRPTAPTVGGPHRRLATEPHGSSDDVGRTMWPPRARNIAVSERLRVPATTRRVRRLVHHHNGRRKETEVVPRPDDQGATATAAFARVNCRIW
jgi:hypothetical protein